MERSLKKHLEDIRMTISDIEMVIDRFGNDYHTFLNEIMFRRCIEHGIIMTGNAIQNLLQINPDLQITSALKIIDAGNHTLHFYDDPKPELLWNIITNDISLLKQEVTQLLGEE